MKVEMSSRQRMLAALSQTEPDHAPCSFMLYNALKDNCHDYCDFIERQLSLGLDAFVQIPPRPPTVSNDWYNLHGLPVSYDLKVTTHEWIENRKNERYPVLVKEYHTPGGTLRAEVLKSDEWRWGNHVPFFDDYLQTHSRKYLINTDEDLQALQYLLVPPTRDEIRIFKEESKTCITLARQHDLLVAGGWGVGVDVLGWIYGLQNMIFAVKDHPDFLTTLLDIIAAWNRFRMKVVLEQEVDLYIRRAWYENCDFWSPRSYQLFIAPILQKEIDMVHRKGAKFGYIITSNCMPLLDTFAELGIDVLIGVDPTRWDIEATKRKLRGKVCLWGGANGHLTVEMGTEEQVRTEVKEAVRILAVGGGFILSPVDNVRQDTPVSRRNVMALIDEWRNSQSL